MKTNGYGFHSVFLFGWLLVFFVLIKASSYTCRVFHIYSVEACLAAQFVVGPFGVCGLCVPCGVAIFSAAFVEDVSFVHSLAGV